jgi:coenzyme PQQ synthesis protein D (PqqD)
MPGEAYLTNPQVMHETIEGETIIIDLSTGTYFSLRGSGPAIWNALAGGADAEGLRQTVERAYEAAPGEIDGAIEAFLVELEGEGLIAPGTATAAPGPTLEPVPSRIPFEPPQLEKYEDLQDIILLDPVHMVDDAGWPHVAPAARETA